MNTGNLEVMKIIGYKDSSFSKATMIDEYDALVNPETYHITYDVQVNKKGAQGSYVPVASYGKGLPQTISFKILFDGTGIIKGNTDGALSSLSSGLAILGSGTGTSVADQINKFKNVTYTYQSDTHQPPFVQIQWGNLIYNCRLTRLTISFKLLKPDGTPLRAEADCSFTGFITEKKLAAIQNNQSPDITHTRIVAAGDTLPLLCYREYGDSKYYYQVARFNQLTDIKLLTPGMKLIFPPIANN